MSEIPKVDPEAVPRALQKKAERKQARQERLEERGDETAGRIASRIVKAANKGNFSTRVRGGKWGIREIQYGTWIYEKVAEHLGEQGIKFAIYDDSVPGEIFIGVGFMQTSKKFQTAEITEIDGQETGLDMRPSRIFPPLSEEEKKDLADR